MAKSAFGEFHDVAFMHERNRLHVAINTVLYRLANKSLRALPRHWLDADAGT